MHTVNVSDFHLVVSLLLGKLSRDILDILINTMMLNQIEYILIFVAINLAIALYVYSKSANIIFSSIMTAPFASIVLLLIDYLLLGYFDPFALFGFFFLLAYCLICSFVILYCYKIFKNKKNRQA